jgi:hypothetical protein
MRAISIASPHAHGAESVTVEVLVRVAGHCREGVEVAGGGWQVDRLHRVAAEQMRDVEALAELDQIAVVRKVADAPAALEI